MEKFFWMLGKDSFSNSFWNYSKNKFSQLENNEKSDKDILFVCKGWQGTVKSLYLTKQRKDLVKENCECL